MHDYLSGSKIAWKLLMNLSLLSTAEETILVISITVQLTEKCCFTSVDKSAEQGKEPKEESPEPGRED